MNHYLFYASQKESILAATVVNESKAKFLSSRGALFYKFNFYKDSKSKATITILLS